jgi:hypothetical protein
MPRFSDFTARPAFPSLGGSVPAWAAATAGSLSFAVEQLARSSSFLVRAHRPRDRWARRCGGMVVQQEEKAFHPGLISRSFRSPITARFCSRRSPDGIPSSAGNRLDADHCRNSPCLPRPTARPPGPPSPPQLAEAPGGAQAEGQPVHGGGLIPTHQPIHFCSPRLHPFHRCSFPFARIGAWPGLDLLQEETATRLSRSSKPAPSWQTVPPT